MVNTSKTTMLFSTDSALGIVDIRSLGFYNIKHATLQYNLSQQLPQYNKITAEHVEQIKTKHVPKQGSHVEQESQEKLQQSADDPYLGWIARILGETCLMKKSSGNTLT